MPINIPLLRSVIKVETSVIVKIKNCSYPFNPASLKTFGDASLYPVYTKIAISAAFGTNIM